MKNEEIEYRTTNFHIAVWLMMNNKKLIEVDWINKRRAEFVFENFQDQDILVDDFFKQNEIQNYIATSQELKARMYAKNSPEIYDRNS